MNINQGWVAAVYLSILYLFHKVVGGVGDGGRSRQAYLLRRWAVEVRVFTHAHVSMITYRVYRSRPIDASLLCLALNWRACTHGLAGRDGDMWSRVAPF